MSFVLDYELLKYLILSIIKDIDNLFSAFF